jgi:hypothetical protein
LVSLVALCATALGNDVTVYVYDREGKLRDDVRVGYSIDGAEAEKAVIQENGVFGLPLAAGSKLTLDVESISVNNADRGVAEIVLDGSAVKFALTLDGESVSVRPISDRALVDIAGNAGPSGAPGPNGCTAAVSCQISDLLGQGAAGTLAANASGTFEVADNFQVNTAGNITNVCIFGIYLNFTTFADCAATTGDALTITYYADAGGSPGAVVAGPFAVANTRVDTGRNLVVGALSFDEYRLTASHAAVPAAMGASLWMGVFNNTTAPCAFAWLTAPPGDGLGAQDGGAGFAPTDYDLSWCHDIDSGGPPPPPPPANDMCADAIPVAVPSVTMGTTTNSTIDPAPFCFTSVTTGGVWYTVTGTGGMLRATTCDAAGFGGSANYDSKISVYCGDCGDVPGLTCVAGNDDNCIGGTNGLFTTTTWCSQAGATYLVLVHGFGGATGNFAMAISETAPSCGGAVFCLTAGACCIDLGGGLFDCVVTTASDCAAMGGDYQGDFSDCPATSYTVSACNGMFEDIENPDPMGNMGMALGLSDDNGVVLPLGFTFDFFGSPKTTVGVTSNGYLTFGTTLGDFTNDPIPNTLEPNDMIAPLWDDFNPFDGGEVYAGTFGMAPNRAFVASWVDVPQFGGVGDSNTFQAILFESGRISFRYLGFSPPSFAGDITVGVENATGTAGTSIDAATIMNGDCIDLMPDVPTTCGSPIVADVEPGECPNMLSGGHVRIAIPGTATHAAAEIDADTVRVRRVDGVGGILSPYRHVAGGPLGTIVDVTSPFHGPLGACDVGSPDGVEDFVFDLRKVDMAEVLQIDTPGAGIALRISGQMADQRTFFSEDVIFVEPAPRRTAPTRTSAGRISSGGF